VVLSAFSSFPGFSEVGETLQQFVINNFVPAAGEVVARYSRPGKLRGGKLDVLVANSTVLQELKFQELEILRQLNQALPEAEIRGLKLRVGQIV